MSDFIKSIDSVRYCPASMMSLCLNDLQKRKDGTYIPPDPTNPFSYLMEMACTLTSVGMVRNDINTRRMYAKLASKDEDIYLHMSDKDYIGRFSIPSMTEDCFIALNMDELLVNAVMDDTTGIRKVVIGRDSQFRISGVNLAIHYPIEVRILPSGNISVVYDSSIVSPLYTLKTNTIPHKVRSFGEEQYLEIHIPVWQFQRESYTEPLSSAAGFKKEYTVGNEFYHCRVYNRVSTNGRWVELKTTHSDQTYSPSQPTAVLTRLKGKLQVRFPIIYFTNGRLRGEVRVDILSTRGDFTMGLSEYSPEHFSWQWNEYDDKHDGIYTAPLNLMTKTIMYSSGTLEGGHNEMTFDELKSKVVEDIDTVSVPVSMLELDELVSSRGFTALEAHDGITDRQYGITKQLPAPTNHETRTSIASNLELIIVERSELHSLSTVSYDDTSTTICDGTLYQKVANKIVPVSDMTKQQIADMEADNRVSYVNNQDFYYSPFHYVIDSSTDVLSVVPYYLNSPVIESKRFLAENGATVYQCSTSAVDVSRIDSGYRLTIITNSTDDVKNLPDDKLKLQAAFLPWRESNFAYSMAKYAGRTADNERVFTVDVETDFLFKFNDQLVINNFDMFKEDLLKHEMSLTEEFHLFYIIEDKTVDLSDINESLGEFQLTDDSRGITEEVCVVKFGDPLKALHCNHRMIPMEVKYQKHKEDVPLLYAADVLERNADGSAIPVITDGKITLKTLHRAGDPVMVDGKPVIKFPAGSNILNDDGLPIPIDGFDELYSFEIALFDATYLYSTEPTIKEYLKRIPEEMTSWIVNDVIDFRKSLLELTSLLVIPRGSSGQALVSITDGDDQTIPSEQSIGVVLYVNDNIHENIKLRNQISREVKDILNIEISKVNVSISAIQEIISDLSTDINSVQITGLGPNHDMYSIKIVGNGDALSINKQLVLEQNGIISIKDDISVGFIKQSRT